MAAVEDAPLLIAWLRAEMTLLICVWRAVGTPPRLVLSDAATLELIFLLNSWRRMYMYPSEMKFTASCPCTKLRPRPTASNLFDRYPYTGIRFCDPVHWQRFSSSTNMLPMYILACAAWKYFPSTEFG